MKKINFLGTPEKLQRDISLRLKNKTANILAASKFGEEYFDGTRAQGYGGYHYDGRWIKVAKSIVKRYNLSSGHHFLDVGCAKGFLLHDIKSICEGLIVRGLDISEYARQHSYMQIRDFIDIGCCSSLPYPDNSFDGAVAINTIHNLEPELCKSAVKELIRVTKNKKNIFIQVDAYSNDNERKMFENWALTAKTYMKPEQWKSFFREIGFEGDYFWTIIGFDN